jgi:hypothetical protein
MATLQEDIYTIKHVAYKGNPGGDQNLKDALIQHWIGYYREVAINQQLKENPSAVTIEHFQQLGCIELKEADLMECPCYDASWGCLVKKATIPMPITVNGSFQLFIGLTNRMEGIPILPSELVRNQMYAKFTGKNVGTIEPLPNGQVALYLYLKSDQLEDLEIIYGRGAFIEPTLVNNTALVNGVCVPTCYDALKDRYPMSGTTRGMVYSMIFERELKLTLAGMEDLFANSQDDDTLLKLQYMMNINDKQEDGQTQRGRPSTRQTVPSQTRQQQ